MIFYKDGYFYSNLINDSTYFSGFSTKKLGNGKKRDDVVAFLNRELPGNDLVIPEQQHTDTVHTVTSSNYQGTAEFADAIVTSTKKLSLGVLTADCVPLLYVDKETGVIAASHQGWKGTMRRLPQKVIKKMTDLGAKKENIIVVIGPSIGGCCYKIYGQRKTDFELQFPEYFNRCLCYSGGESFLNLSQLSYYQLIEAGIDKKNIDYFPFCTKCNQEKFFSFQREGKIEGEMFHVIAMR